jgi:hypothetical protein
MEDGQAGQRRAALHTRADAWRTAAVMTCLLPPIGLVCGALALIALRSIAAKIDRGRETDAQRALRLGRGLVLAGTAFGALFALVAATRMILFSFRITSLQP